ncbi:Uncharacterised protein [Shigella sonnei]|nr:Uncharacterised protein [Shigella sonnei]SRN37751.1 Uncharacterised protein [Shigella flexneri]CSI14758.1 Uncharacterised protein [Shigella sonnei]CSP71903.1 Uncharacterised protein [Shigella sonnei]CSP79766.1 Uncharacterised protein [Shigella sonnei]
MHQKIDGIDILQQGRKVIRPAEIDFMATDVCQLQLCKPVDMTCRRQDLMPLLAECAHQMLTNVATGTEN